MGPTTHRFTSLALFALSGACAACAPAPVDHRASNEVAPSAPSSLLPAIDVLTQHNDTFRTGGALAETELTVSTVQSNFGHVFDLNVDDQVYSQPLFVSGLALPAGARDVVYVATVNNTLYAFDATSGARLWSRNFSGAGRPPTNQDVGPPGTYVDFSGNLGIVGTPVIDRARGALFFVSRTIESEFVQRLHAVDLATGAELPGSPIVVTAAVFGTGHGSSNGVIAFDPRVQNQRPALLLSGNRVYVAWSSHGDYGFYHGWVIAYDASSLARVAVFNDTPDGAQGGIWQSGNGLIADEHGDVYAAAGNGDTDGTTNFGSSAFRLDGASLGLLDYFTPTNASMLNEMDLDFGCSSMMVPGSGTMIVGTKNGDLWSIPRYAMGTAFHVAADFAPASESDHIHSGPVYWNGPLGPRVYVWGENDYLRAWSVSARGQLQTPSVDTGSVLPPDGMPGAMLSLSALGSTPGTGILWATHPLTGNANHQVRPGILRAFDASNLENELWNSETNPSDSIGLFAKFAPVTVAAGKVFVPTFSNRVAVFGLR